MACWLPYWTTQHIPVIAENSVIQCCRAEVFQFPVLEQKGEGRKREDLVVLGYIQEFFISKRQHALMKRISADTALTLHYVILGKSL